MEPRLYRQTDDRQTGRRQHNSNRECKFTFTKYYFTVYVSS